jgi:hypothetical protein
MLEFLRGRASDRKLRLCAVAFYWKVWDGSGDEIGRKAVEVAERYADGQATKKELTSARDAAFAACTTSSTGTSVRTSPITIWATLESMTPRDAYRDDRAVQRISPGVTEARAAKDRILADLLRDIFGPLPFRSVNVQLSWVQWKDGAVLHLARSIYEDRKFEDLPILADALEESGCTGPDILGHCRSGGDHVRGCWVVDRILGME